MFETEINGLEQTRHEFTAAVKDSFGRSIEDDVFELVSTELHALENEYSIAEMKMNEVKMLTMELRTIV